MFAGWWIGHLHFLVIAAASWTIFFGSPLSAQEARSFQKRPKGSLQNSLQLKSDYRPVLLLKISSDAPMAKQDPEGISVDFGNVDGLAGADSPAGDEGLAQDAKGAVYQTNVKIEVGVAGFDNVQLQASCRESDSIYPFLYEAPPATDFRFLKRLNKVPPRGRALTAERGLRSGWHEISRQIVLHIPEDVGATRLEGTITYTLSTQ